jgi:hypothetical protein
MRFRSLKALLLTSALCSVCVSGAEAATAATTAPAAAPNDFMSALTNGTLYWQERYRYENVEQRSFATNANAETLRTILGYKTGVYKDFQIDGAVLNVAQFGGHDYNDGSDGKTQFPAIGDPGTTQLFHATLAYTGLPQTTIIAGRQEIALDNQRWVGNPGWRQIQQTFDGVTIDNKSIDNVDIFYAHLFHQNRSGGDNVSNGTYDMDGDLFHVAFTGIKNVKLIGYSYLDNVDNTVAGVPGSTHGFSTATTGVRAEAKVPLDTEWQVTGNGEYARQNDFGNNPNSFGLNYYLIEPGAIYNKISGKVGYEVMGSNGTESVQSPMMSAHAMNGWADQFTTIPVNGLVDKYVNASYRFQLPCKWLNESKLEGFFHHYEADQNDTHYGNEYDLDFTQKFADHFAAGVQFEDYKADKLLVDARKIIMTLQFDY